MSLRDKYTDEEWDAIPPFTGFSHNKFIDEISKSIKLGLDNLPNTIKYPKKYVEEVLVDRIKKENQPRDVIQNIVDKIHERKLSGKQCEVAIMSYSDYDLLQSMNDFEIHSVWIAGYLLKIHPSPNLKDGEIEIY